VTRDSVRRVIRRIVGAIPLALAGCSVAPLPVAIRPAGLARPAAVLYLIGDAGAATPDDPAVQLLSRDVRSETPGTPVVVAFLGDNIYQSGLRDGSDPGFPADSAHLEAQVDVVRGTTARGLFLPGNHDWGDGRANGIRRLRNLRAFLERRARRGVPVELAPVDGCPGPVVRRLGDVGSLVLLDTQWWLEDPRYRIDVACAHRTEDEVARALASAISAVPSDRAVIVLAHHPLQSFGPHGGHFSARQILFPLTDVVSWLYLPLPFVVPAARTAGISNEDLSGPRYRAMRAALVRVLAGGGRAALLYAAGHEHSLQVIEGGPFGVGLHVVSGAGSKLTPVTRADGALFVAGEAHGELGYMRLELFDDSSALLSVFTDGTRSCPADEEPCVPRRTLRYVRRLDR